VRKTRLIRTVPTATPGPAQQTIPIVQLGHCRADHPERLDHDWPIGIDVLRAVEIDRIDAAARYKFLPIDDL